MKQALEKVLIGSDLSLNVVNNKAKIENVYGNTEQETSIQGKNLLDLTKCTLHTQTSAKVSLNSKTANTIDINGVEGAGAWDVLSFDLTPILKESGTYFYAFKVAENSAVSSNTDRPYGVIGIHSVNKSDGSVVKNEVVATNTNDTIRRTINIDIENYLYRLVFYPTGGTVLANNGIFKYENLYIAKETTFSGYEPFVPNMPSPDYPSNIRNVGDNINIVKLPNRTERTENGLTYSIVDGVMTVNGTATATTHIRGLLYSLAKKTTTYTLNITPISGSWTKGIVGISFRSSNDTQLAYHQTAYSKPSASKEISGEVLNSTSGMNFFINSGSVFNNYKFKLKLEEGKVATSHSEYGCGSVGLQIDNKNVLGYKKNGTITYNGLTITYEDGIFTLNGKSEYNGYLNLTDILKVASNNVEMDNQPKKRLHNGKYTFSYNYISGTKDNTGFHFYIRDTASSSNTINHNLTNLHLTNTQKTFSITELDYVCYIWVSLNVTFTNFKFSFQLEKGETKTNWVQHQQQKTIFPLAEGQLLHKGDYLAEDGIHQVRKTIVFDGSEEFKITTSSFGMRFAFALQNSKVSNSTQGITSDCSHFPITVLNGTYTNKNCYVITNTDIIFSLDETYTTLEQFKSYVAEQYANGTPVTVEYELAEEEIIPYTKEQKIAYEEMQNISLYNGINHIYFDYDLEVIFKMLYIEKNIIDDKVYVLDKEEVLLTIFDKEDDNTIINPRITETQNAESTFSFSISPNNPKWQEINNPENLYYVDGKVYSTNFEGCFTEVISENNEDLIGVIAYERQKLLSRKYVRTWNSTDGFENIDTFMVVVLSKGKLPLKNNNIEVVTNHLPGTSGYVLDALLYGTGWSTGECDVEGIFDFETDQIDIYENILKVQQIWGGILIFDSVNKKVHHRDETKYLPYNGYEVKYQKNMQSLEKLYNNRIVTKLCPLGEGGLNIKSVNNGEEWLTNNEYTTSVLEGIENNPDIYEPEQLKRWGERKLKDLCKPRKELTVQFVLLKQVEGYELEEIAINHIVDIINYNGIDNDIEQLRVVRYEHGIWDYSDAILELSDITLESTDIFKKTVSASNSINNGTINSNKVVNFFKNGQTITETMRQIDKTIEQTKSTLTKSDDEIKANIEQVNTGVDNLNNEIVSQKETIEELKITLEGLENQIIETGGDNLIRNSVGFFGNEYWEGTIVTATDTDVQYNNESDNAIKLQSGSIIQNIVNLKNGDYNISFNYKLLSLATTPTVKVKINDVEEELTANTWTTFEKQISITNHSFKIEFNSTANNSCLISDLLLLSGKYKQVWSQNSNETTTDTVTIGKGIQVNSTTKNTYARFDADGNRIFNTVTGNVVTELTDLGVDTDRVKSDVTETGGILVQEIDGQTWFSSLL